MFDKISLSMKVMDCLLSLNGLTGVLSAMLRDPEHVNDDSFDGIEEDIDYISYLANSVIDDIIKKKENNNPPLG